METNLLFVALAALVPLVMGFIWYHPKVFGTAWLKGTSLTEADVKKGPKPTVFVFSYILSFMAAYLLLILTNHQSGIFSLLVTEPGFNEAGSEVNQFYTSLMERFDGKFRTFGHGSFHGAIAGLFLAFPVLATNGMFEGKTWKHNAINVAYWVITFAIMGGIVCAWA